MEDPPPQDKVGLDAQVALIESDEHHEVRHPVRCQIMEPQAKVAKEPLHKRVRKDPEPGEVELDEGDDLRFPRCGLRRLLVQQMPQLGGRINYA